MKFNFDSETDRQFVVNAIHHARMSYATIVDSERLLAKKADDDEQRKANLRMAEQFEGQIREAQRLADQIEQDGEE